MIAAQIRLCESTHFALSVCVCAHVGVHVCEPPEMDDAAGGGGGCCGKKWGC